MTHVNSDRPVRWFNRACAGFALAFLIATLGVKQFYHTSEQDFTQYYMGALLARHAAWDSMYPDPVSGLSQNLGAPENSTLKPRAAELAATNHVPHGTRYMQPPPLALLVAPLGFLPHPQARAVWYAAAILAAWGISLQAGRIYKICDGRTTRVVGLIILLVALSPQAHRWVRSQNLSAVTGLLIGWSVLELFRRDSVRGGAAICLGTIAKYAPVALVPLYLAMRRWKSLGCCVALGIIFTLASWGVMGSRPFRDYVREVAPTLGRTFPHMGNQALEAFILRAAGWQATPRGLARTLLVVKAAVLCVVLAAVLLRRKSFWNSPPNVCAAAAALLLWMLIFSPVFWDHYQAYVAPLWGWMIWEARRSALRAVVVILAIALVYVPSSLITSFRESAREPFTSHLLYGSILMFVLALARLLARGTSAKAQLAS
jgi:hypothetical protein